MPNINVYIQNNCMYMYLFKNRNNLYYHSLYSVLDFDWLIHLQIIGANTLLSMRTLKMLRQLQ